MSCCIGLTGGIGSGKTTVAAMFGEYGAAVVDSDAISHRLTQPGGAAIPAICVAFGDGCLDAEGSLDRAQMRRLVFADPAAKKRLEAILHPMIREQVQARIRAADAAPYVLLVVPLLFETQGYRDIIRRALVVDCAPETQVARAMRRSGLEEGEVRAIMAQQIARAERLQRADDIIHNDADLGALRQQVELLHRRYLTFSTENG
ncbi:MAG: dephospho-CoA kinase [Nitrosomonadales bacterium]|nr:dephospho-CoA kinase [Nitrosomonadales bacterium]